MFLLQGNKLETCNKWMEPSHFINQAQYLNAANSISVSSATGNGACTSGKPRSTLISGKHDIQMLRACNGSDPGLGTGSGMVISPFLDAIRSHAGSLLYAGTTFSPDCFLSQTEEPCIRRAHETIV